MARYRPLSDGLYEVETSAGLITVPSTEEELQANGYTPDVPAPPVPPPVGPRLAFNGAGGAPGNVPAQVPDVPPQMGPGSGAGGAPAQRLDQDLFRGAPNAPEKVAPDERVTSVTKESREIKEDGSVVPTERAKPRTKMVDVSIGPKGGSGPSKMVAVGEVRKSGKKVSQDLLDADSDAAINQRLAIQERGDREAERAARLGEVADDALRQQEQEISAQQIRQQQLKDEYARRQAVIDREREEVDQLKIDPDQVFSDGGGTFAKVIAGISMLAGGVLQGMHGMAQNPAQVAINSALDRNIELQKEAIERRRQGLHGRETELERLINTYGSPEVAERELRNRQMALVEAHAKRATLDSPEDIRANVQASLADFEAKRVADRMAIDQAAQDEVTTQFRMSGGGSGGGRAPGGKGTAQALRDIAAAKASLNRFLATHEAAGRPGVLTTGVFGSDDSQELGAQAEAIAPGLGRALEGNAPNESTMKAIREGMLSPDGEKIQKAARAYISQLEDRERAILGDAAPEEPEVEADD